MKNKFTIVGMSCSSCASTIEKNVSNINGVDNATVNLLTNSMEVEFNEKLTNIKTIVKEVEKLDYECFILDGKNIENKPLNNINVEFHKESTEVVLSGIFTLLLMFVAMGSLFGFKTPLFLDPAKNVSVNAFVQFLLTLPVLYINRNIFISGFKKLFKLHPNMDTLIAVGSFSAILQGVYTILSDLDITKSIPRPEFNPHGITLYFESAVMILTLIRIGKLLEHRAKKKTSSAISKLIDLVPANALVLRNHQELLLPIEEIVVNDIVLIKSGDKIPIDGVIIEGVGSFNQSAITGESIPVDKTLNDNVISASICTDGFVKVKVTKVGQDTMLAQIVKLVEEASATKAPIAKLANKVSGIFVPLVIAISVITFIGWFSITGEFNEALMYAISVLVISCPCALGLATPTAIMVGTGKGAENGVLIKSAESLEVCHNATCVVLDKTGTITKGTPKVTDFTINPRIKIDPNTVLLCMTSIENLSSHPLAKAVVEYTISKNIRPRKVDDFKSITGKGVTAKINNSDYYVGNYEFISSFNIEDAKMKDIGNKYAEQGKTPIYFANEKYMIAIMAIADEIKESSKSAVQQMQNMGLKVCMLTGDNENTANYIKDMVGIQEVFANTLPQEKENIIKTLQEKGENVIMVGDGINDAPALTRANVGMAIANGSDIAIESADIVLVNNDLSDICFAITLSKKVMNNIKQNLFWAFFYNVIGIPLAAGVFVESLSLSLNPMFAALAMSLSSFCVVCNALRLKYVQKINKNDK